MNKKLISGLLFVPILLGVLWWYFFIHMGTKESIRVGILHSLTGTLALNELNMVDAARLAIDEINQNGGVMGRLIEPIFYDGKSDDDVFAQGAEHLITKEQVNVIFGCWSSSSRKSILPIIEKHNHLLVYPTSYEGLEQSPNILYIGATPNQKFMPAVTWALENIGKKFFIIGSEYIAPVAETEFIRLLVSSRGGQLLGVEFLPLGSLDIVPIVDKIMELKPEVIIDIVGGFASVAFFKELRARGITNEKMTVLTFNVTEPELNYLGYTMMIGDYSPSNYFQTVDNPVNKEFVKNFKKKYGKNRVIGQGMEGAYVAVYMWKEIVEKAHSYAVADVLKNIPNTVLSAPEGIVYTDYENNHTWRTTRIGKIRSDGQFDIVWDGGQPVRPLPYPPYKTREEWDALVESLYEQWGKKWGVTLKE